MAVFTPQPPLHRQPGARPATPRQKFHFTRLSVICSSCCREKLVSLPPAERCARIVLGIQRALVFHGLGSVLGGALLRLLSHRLCAAADPIAHHLMADPPDARGQTPARPVSAAKTPAQADPETRPGRRTGRPSPPPSAHPGPPDAAGGQVRPMDSVFATIYADQACATGAPARAAARAAACAAGTKESQMRSA
jgi:hypothetical protein